MSDCVGGRTTPLRAVNARFFARRAATGAKEKRRRHSARLVESKTKKERKEKAKQEEESKARLEHHTPQIAFPVVWRFSFVCSHVLGFTGGC